MAEIRLVFKPDVSEVSKAVKSIQDSISKELGHIKINVDSGAQQATQNLAANLQRASQNVGNLTGEFAKLTTTYSGLEKTEENMTRQITETNEALGKRVRVIDNIKKGQHSYTTEVIEDNEKIQKSQAELDRAYAQGYAQREKEIQKKQREIWNNFLKETEEYKAQQQKLEDQKIAQAQAANRQMVIDEEEALQKRSAAWKAYFDEINGLSDAKTKQGIEDNKRAILDEEEAQRKRTAAWKAYFDEINKGIAQEERANKEREKASETAVTLERQYSNLIRQIQNLKAQYPEGTFDAIEQQAREARDELRNLDRTSRDYAKDVDRLAKTHQGLQRDLANTREEEKKLDKVTESLWMNIQKFARWYIIGNAFTKIMNSFREALSTMKEVDMELANIQKVTDRTDAEMQQLAESAYKAASAYGVTANAYLESAAEFAKAGFGDRAEALAEVAIKTQLVGDVSADVADKFLLASNAAWKMDGNMQLLNKTLDAANIIENNYATSIEKLAAGMPIAASVAANAGMTFEQTIAALGTITSVTQETGTKAATALRALILNIIGAVGEYEDGIEVTEESVKSLDGILQVYAKDAMKAAQEAGTVINPMEAIAALAKASKEGLVNQAELFEILSSLGGKLRTNQLISLVQNYDTFLEMLDKTTESAGSADKEIGIMLDTWEAKTNILQNTWTEFVTHFVNTEGIKTSIDIVTGLISLLDTKAGHLLITAAGIPTVIFAIAAVVAKLKDSVAGLTAAMAANPMFLAIAAGGVAISGLIALADALTTSTKEYADAVKTAEEAYARTQGEIDALKTKSTELTDIERQKLVILEEQERIQKEQVRRAKADQYNALYGDINAYEQATALVEQYLAYKDRLEKTTDPEVFRKTSQGLNNVYTNILDTLSGLLDFREALGFLPPSGNEAIRVLNELVNSLRGEEDAAEKAGEATGGLEEKTGDAEEALSALEETLKKASETATKYDTAIGGVVDAMADFGAGSVEVHNAMKALEAAIPGSTDKLYDFDTATVLAREDIFTSKEAMLDFIDSSRQLEFSQAISELENLAAGYWDVAGAALAAMANQQAAAQMAGVLGFTTGGNSPVSSAEAQLGALRRQKAEWDSYISTLRGRKDYSGGGSGSGSGRNYSPVSSAPDRKETDAELERRQKIVSLLKSELSFLIASGKTTGEINEKRKEIQNALHEVAERMREIGNYEEEINTLGTEWWNIQNEIVESRKEEVEACRKTVELLKSELTFLIASGAATAEINAKRKEIQNALHAEAEAMRAIGGYEKEIKELGAEWWNIQDEISKALEEELESRKEIFDVLKKSIDEYYDRVVSDKEKELSLEEKIAAVRKAELDLEKARNNLTVKYWNGSTGQWEWAADRKKVQAAEDSLRSARSGLADYQKELAWKEFRDAWEYVAEQIKAGKMTFDQAYSYMLSETKRLQKQYGTNFSMALEDSIGKFKGVDDTIDTFTEDLAKQLGANIGLMQTELKNYQDAIDTLRNVISNTLEAVQNGELTTEEAYKKISKEAGKISKDFGVDLGKAVDSVLSSNGEAAEKFISALSSVSDAVKAGDMTVADAYAYLEGYAADLSETYGLDMSGALQLGLGYLLDADGSLEEIAGKIRGSVGSFDNIWGGIVTSLTQLNSQMYDATNAAINDMIEQMNRHLTGSLGGGAEAGSGTAGSGTAGSGASASGGEASRAAASAAAVESYGTRGGSVSGTAARSVGLVNADASEQDTLRRMQQMAAAGNTAGVLKELDKLSASGSFASMTENGALSGIVYAVDGNANGASVLALGGKMFSSGVNAGSVVVDANMNYWKVGADGTLSPASGDYSGSWYEQANKRGSLDFRESGSNPALGGGDLSAYYLQAAIANGSIDAAEAYRAIGHGMTPAEFLKAKGTYGVYDKGGLLKGIGGIKATTRDEMVLGPELTEKVLDLHRGEFTKTAMDRLEGLVDLARRSPAITDQRIGSQHNGNIYQLGGVTLSESQAKSTSVYDLSRMALGLGSYRNRN